MPLTRGSNGPVFGRRPCCWSLVVAGGVAVVLVVVAVAVIASGGEEAGVVVVDVRDFWPHVAEDLTTATWGHATNSMEAVREALQDGGVMMLEADVSLGTLDGGSPTSLLPIMAHPPDNTSDLTLEQFVRNIIKVVLFYSRRVPNQYH